MLQALTTYRSDCADKTHLGGESAASRANITDNLLQALREHHVKNTVKKYPEVVFDLKAHPTSRDLKYFLKLVRGYTYDVPENLEVARLAAMFAVARMDEEHASYDSEYHTFCKVVLEAAEENKNENKNVTGKRRPHMLVFLELMNEYLETKNVGKIEVKQLPPMKEFVEDDKNVLVCIEAPPSKQAIKEWKKELKSASKFNRRHIEANPPEPEERDVVVAKQDGLRYIELGTLIDNRKKLEIKYVKTKDTLSDPAYIKPADCYALDYHENLTGGNQENKSSSDEETPEPNKKKKRTLKKKPVEDDEDDLYSEHASDEDDEEEDDIE